MKTKNTIRYLFVTAFVSALFQQAIVANAADCKKWTYDFSEKVTYSDTALEACKKYVKEKYTNDNYAASVEPTNDPETQRCSAGDTYFGLVYLKECSTCCKKPANSPSQPQPVLSQSASCSVSRPANNVSDKDGMFSDTVKRTIEKKLAKFKSEEQVEMAVAAVNTIGQADIFDYSLDLARCWKVGDAAKGGVLLFIAKNDRRWWIQVTNELNKTLTDDIVKRLGDRMGSQFKLGKYDAGVTQLIGDVAAEIEK